MGKIGLRIFSLSILLTYVVVPLISNQLEICPRLFMARRWNLFLFMKFGIMYNSIVFSIYSRNDRSLTKQGERNDLLVYLIIIYVLFLIFSNFREMNVGVQRVINILFPQAVAQQVCFCLIQVNRCVF